ncbi:hypothetical protein CH352_16985 [Leptospira hartskeerlii]|uniref:Lipocalin-like domain-containing protein n=1 Tax=Leptospira hartskeerlii TaxID=2023177 RepID=A0A2M9XIK2_9LEPT|nr:hypothetical protein [Leptospira hartskeerlii]PJZ27500.1 hypothetical protein CH357_02830 [Leptospira hartskeerlii]PJZ32357.1 hypothetical protein CH352_16985 [Leptospira hartskeerlii]
MKRLGILAAIFTILMLAGCKEKAGDLKDSRINLDGKWVQVANCAEGGPNPVAWLEIESNNIRSCVQQPGGTYNTFKGTIRPSDTYGNYKIDWSNGYQQNASYPVGVLKLLSLIDPSIQSTQCYTQNPSYPPNSQCQF